MDEHDAMEIKGQFDDSRKRKRPKTDESVAECVCECKTDQAEAHGLFFATNATMCKLFSWLPKPKDNILVRITKLREENPKYDKFFRSVFRGIAKILWRLNNKESFTAFGSCSRANEEYRKQFKGFIKDLFNIQPELKTAEDVFFAICDGRVNLDKYPMLMWEEEISERVKIYETYKSGYDLNSYVPPTIFARADLKVAEQIIAEVRPLTVDQRTHLLAHLFFLDRDNSLDALILDAFQEMKIVCLYEELDRRELRKIFPSRSSLWEADIDSRIRRIFTNTMFAIYE